MLIGETYCTADNQGRVTIPAEFRAELGEGATVTRGIERCLMVYPASAWRKLAVKIDRRLPLTNRVARAFNRLMFSGALACSLDEQGRMVLPGLLREYADISDEVIIVGLFSHLEIWSPQRWQEMRLAAVDDSVELAEQLTEFGI